MKHIKIIVLLVVLSVSLTAVVSPATYADTTKRCAGADTSVISCKDNDSSTDISETGLWSLLLIAINILTAGVGVVALAGVVYGAVLYTSSAGNPETVKKARTVFTNVVIGVVSFAAMYTLLNFLIPGGVFK